MNTFSIILTLATSVGFAYTTLSTTLSKYPGYTGDVDISGWVSVSVNADTNDLTVTYSLSELEATTAGGLHVHSGKSCTDNSLVGGHYYDTSVFTDPATEPWVPTMWASNADGVGSGTFDVNSGFNTIALNADRTIVAHDSEGNRAACGILTGFNTLSASISVYPGYEGDIAVEGLFLVSEGADSLTMAYELSGLETSTTGGVHIHEGTTCETAENVGGHYWDSQSGTVADPWTPANGMVWTSDASGNGIGPLSLNSGYNKLPENMGHAVVVHNAAGVRIGCGLLEPLPALHAKIGTYPDYQGATMIEGDVEATVTIDGHVSLVFSLKGLEADATGGMHIHSGTTCDTAANVGGHYWDDKGDATANPDPWTPANGAIYTSTADGTARGVVTVDQGFNMLTENLGHAIVVHEAGGTRAGCGTLTTNPTYLESTTVNSYPNYAGTQAITGHIFAHIRSEGMQFEWDLSGLEPSTTGGVHIHEGTSCKTHADVQGHYYDVANVNDFSVGGVDPWNAIKWESNVLGKSSGFAIVDFGHNDLASNLGRAIVVHLAGGTRAGCATLGVYEAPEPVPETTPAPKEPENSEREYGQDVLIFVALASALGMLLLGLLTMFAVRCCRGKPAKDFVGGAEMTSVRTSTPGKWNL